MTLTHPEITYMVAPQYVPQGYRRAVQVRDRARLDWYLEVGCIDSISLPTAPTVEQPWFDGDQEALTRLV